MTIARLKIIVSKTETGAFFSQGIMSLKPIQCEAIETACTDGKTLRYNAAWWLSLTPRQQVGVCIHETLHCLLLHHARAVGKDLTLWNIATDACINTQVLECEYDLPDCCIMPGKYPFQFLVKGASADRNYAALVALKQESEEKAAKQKDKAEKAEKKAKPSSQDDESQDDESQDDESQDDESQDDWDGSEGEQDWGEDSEADESQDGADDSEAAESEADESEADESQDGAESEADESQDGAESEADESQDGAADEPGGDNGSGDDATQGDEPTDGDGAAGKGSDSEGDGQGGDGMPGGYSDPGGCGGVMPPPAGGVGAGESEWRNILVESMSRTQGTGPGCLSQLFKDIVNPQVSWQEILRQYIQEKARNDYSWAEPNRRYVHAGIYLPALSSNELGALIVAVDTSGSVSDLKIAEFLGHIQEIVALNPVKVYLIFCDESIRIPVIEWEPANGPLEFPSRFPRGGTDHRPVFAWVETNIIEAPCCMICLTDLYTSFPREAPTYPVLWAVTGPGIDDVILPFGEAINVDG
jgi:predicted metal-dependent peptidase